MAPRGASATVEIELCRPKASGRVPSIGSTAMSTSGGTPRPSRSPLYNMGASSFSPSPMTMTPSMSTVLSTSRMASTAALSAAILSPRPMYRPAANAAASVTRASSSARLRVGLVSFIPDSSWSQMIWKAGLACKFPPVPAASPRRLVSPSNSVNNFRFSGKNERAADASDQPENQIKANRRGPEPGIQAIQ